MTTSPKPTTRRRHAAGAATRDLLLDTAERLFAQHSIDGVTLRQIQVAAGQSNASAISYHFGSKAGLVQALIQDRYQRIDTRRAELLAEARREGLADDPRTVVISVVSPLLESLEAGEMFVPFLARVSENGQARAEFRPRTLTDAAADVLKELLAGPLAHLPGGLRRGREVQLHNSVLNLLGEHAVAQRALSATRLSNYIDGWVAILIAPPSPDTLALLHAEQDAALSG